MELLLLGLSELLGVRTQQLLLSCAGHLLIVSRLPGLSPGLPKLSDFRDLHAMQQMQDKGCVFSGGAQFLQDLFLCVRVDVKYQKCHTLDLLVYDGNYSVAELRS